MIIKTSRYKLDKPIAFTEIFEVTTSMMHDSFIVSNGEESTVARPVTVTVTPDTPASELRGARIKEIYVDEVEGLDDETIAKIERKLK